MADSDNLAVLVKELKCTFCNMAGVRIKDGEPTEANVAAAVDAYKQKHKLDLLPSEWRGLTLADGAPLPMIEAELHPTILINNDERWMLRAQLLNQLQEAEPALATQPKFAIHLGQPGAQKPETKEAVCEAYDLEPEQTVFIYNPDIMQRLPEFKDLKGKDARISEMVRLEVGHVIAHTFEQRMFESGANIVFEPAIGELSKMIDLISEAKKNGYSVEMNIYVTDPEIAKDNIARDYAETGRFQPQGYINQRTIAVVENMYTLARLDDLAIGKVLYVNENGDETLILESRGTKTDGLVDSALLNALRRWIDPLRSAKESTQTPRPTITKDESRQ